MASITHMGVAPTDHVLLYALRNITGGCPQAGYEFFRANVGGLGSAPNPDVDPPFHIRRGGHLVVTDVDWDYIHPQGAAAAGFRQELVLRVQRLAVPTQVMSVFKSACLLNGESRGGAPDEHDVRVHRGRRRAAVCRSCSPARPSIPGGPARACRG